MSSRGSKQQCAGFVAHSINPNRCKRCFQDASEHGDGCGSGTTTTTPESNNKNKNNATTVSKRSSSSSSSSSTPLYTTESVRIRSQSFQLGGGTTNGGSDSRGGGGGAGTGTTSHVMSSSSTPPSSSSSTSASFTIKQKRVKFSPNANDDDDNGNDNGSGSSGTLPTANKSKTVTDSSKGTTAATNKEINPNTNVEFTISMKKQRKPSFGSMADDGGGSGSGGGGGYGPRNTNEDYQSRIKELSQELSKAKEKIDNLEAKNKELDSMRKSFSKESKDIVKHNFDENIKLKQKIDKLENTIGLLKNEKKSSLTDSDSRFKSSSSSTSESSLVTELRAQLAASEKLVAKLAAENDEIKRDVKSLEVEFQELHDNFHEDQSSEFRVLKRELEAMGKNCRVMQFKLKKADRTIEQLENEKIDLQKKVNDLYETAKMDVDKRRMKELENELAIAKEVSLKLHAEIETLRDERMLALEQLQELQRLQPQISNKHGPSGVNRSNDPSPSRLSSNSVSSSSASPSLQPPHAPPKLSPTPSFDQSTKDYEQVVRDLYDTMERERDLQEQLKFAEEETKTMRKKLSTMEQENEILMMQIRKMTSKNKGSAKDDDSDNEELNPEEMKLHLELYEQEMIVLRRKTDELEQENENFHQEIKYLQEKLVSQPLAKVEIPEIPVGSPPNVIYEHKIRILEAEARELRKKLVDKEKENESLRTEVDLHRRRASNKMIIRTRSLDGEGQSLDTKKQLQLFEQEANMLRQKMITLENENEKLCNENKRLQLRISKKPPPGPVDQLQLENIELKDKIRDLERKCDTLKTDLMNAKLNETTETETDYIANLKKQLRSKEQDIASLNTKMAQIDLECTRINREYKKLKESLAPRRRVNRVIRETATRLELKEIIKEMEEEMNELQNSNRAKDAVIDNLGEEVSELKHDIQVLDTKHRSTTTANGVTTQVANDEIENLRKRLQDEQHRTKGLETKLEKLSKEKNIPMNMLDKLEVLQAEKKELAIALEDAQLELQKYRSKVENFEAKFDVQDRNKEDIVGVNKKLRETLEKAEDEVDELSKKLKSSETTTKELVKKLDDTLKELTRVTNVNEKFKTELEESRSKLSAINSRTGGVSEQSALLQKECNDLKRKLDESRQSISLLESQLSNAKVDHKKAEAKWQEVLGEKLDTTAKKVRREVHHELQSLREESTNYRNRCGDLTAQLEKTERDLRDANEKIKSHNVVMRKERDELNERIVTLENQAKAEQRKRDKLERELEQATRGKEEELLQAQDKIVQLERDIRRHQARLEDVEYEYQGKLATSERELTKLKQEYEDLTNKYDELERDFVQLKSRAVSEKETLVETIDSLKRSYEDKVAEIKNLKEISMSQQKEWYKEKLNFQESIASYESQVNKLKLIEEERNRMKILIKDKENLLNSYRKEERSHNEERECTRIRMDELLNKLTELEKVERNTRFLSITGRAQVDKELQDYRIRLEHSETSHKGELAALHAEYEGRMRLLGEEVEHMQQQIALLAQERDRYRDSLERTTREYQTRQASRSPLCDEIEDLNSQLRTLRADMEGALLENRNLKIQHGTERSGWQIQIAEYKTQINQLEERTLLETRGNTRNYARTKMELAWDKERQENQRLLQETQRFIQELRDKLIGTESLREKERAEAHRQLLELKTNMDREQVETQQKIAELHFDLLALKEAHARLKSQNERLKRERATLDKGKIDLLTEEFTELRRMAAQTGTPKSIANELEQLQQRLKTRLEKLKAEVAAKSMSSSELSIASKLGNGKTGSMSSISSTTLPPPNTVKRAPPRAKLLNKKSLSLDQQLTSSGLRGASQERIWDSDHSVNTTPNSSVSNLRFGASGAPRYGYAGYESDSSGSSFFLPPNLRVRPGFARESSYGAGGSESDTSAASSAQHQSSANKKTLKDKLKLRKSSRTSDPGGVDSTESEQMKKLKQKVALAGFEMSPLELAKQREKKEKSLRYKISKTLSKTFSRSTSVLLPEEEAASSKSNSSGNRSKSPSSRNKSPTRRGSQEDNKKTETNKMATSGGETNRTKTLASSGRYSATSSSSSSTPSSTTTTPTAKAAPTSTSSSSSSNTRYTSTLTVPGVAQLRQRPTQSNLAVPPSRRSPPKIRLPTETNV